MDSQLKPCPHCGSTDLQVDWNSVYECHFVRCYNCHMQGPEIYGREKAAEAWNNLPRRHTIYPNVVDCEGCPERRYHKDLKWTNESPKEPGFYWWRAKNIPPTVASVITKGEIDYWHREGCEWAGPITAPK